MPAPHKKIIDANASSGAHGPGTIYNHPPNPRRFRLASSAPEHCIASFTEVEACYDRFSYPHHHPTWQILMIVEGGLTMHVGDDRWELLPGNAVVLPPQLEHRAAPVVTTPRVVFFDIHLIDGVNPTIDWALRAIDLVQPKALDQVEFLAITDRFRKGARVRHGEPFGVITMMSALWSLFGELCPPASPDLPGGEPADDPRVRVADSILHAQLGQPLDINRLSEQVNLSASQLTRLFRHSLGMAPAQRLRQIRIDAARQMLQSSTLSVKEIAHACGFANANHFSRIFHEVVGQTPTKLRKNACENPPPPGSSR